MNSADSDVELATKKNSTGKERKYSLAMLIIVCGWKNIQKLEFSFFRIFVFLFLDKFFMELMSSNVEAMILSEQG